MPCGFSNCSTNTLAEKPPWGPLSTPLGVTLENSGPSLVCMKCSEHLDLLPFFFLVDTALDESKGAGTEDERRKGLCFEGSRESSALSLPWPSSSRDCL